MATGGNGNGIRIREPIEPTGVILGQRAVEDKYRRYGLTRSTLRGWIKAGKISVAETPQGQAISDQDVRACLTRDYAPHQDNQGRQRRPRTIPEERADQQAQAAAPAPPTIPTDWPRHIPGSGGGMGRRTRVMTPAGSGLSPAGVRLDTREWVDRFYAFQRGHGRDWKTLENCQWALEPFARRHPVLPLTRQEIVAYVDRLTAADGRVLTPGSRTSVLKRIRTLYHWLDREHGESIQVRLPDLTRIEIPAGEDLAVPIREDDVPRLLRQCLNHTEATIVLLLAETAVRVGELCTIQAELLRPDEGWAPVWGKRTKANTTGGRTVPIPQEALGHLLDDIQVHGDFTWVNRHGRKHILAGSVEQVQGRRADWDDPRTYRVQPAPGAVSLVQELVARLMRHAGIYQRGMGPHSFRRMYQSAIETRAGVQEPGSHGVINHIMGHFSRGTIQQIYNHTTIEQMVEFSRRFAPQNFTAGPRAGQE